jgi:hypothetical protein
VRWGRTTATAAVTTRGERVAQDNEMTADDDKADDQPATAAADNDATADVPDSPRTAAAELHSEAPTTIVPDVEPTRAAELAWSSEAETEEIADHPREWRGRLLWRPNVFRPNDRVLGELSPPAASQAGGQAGRRRHASSGVSAPADAPPVLRS